MEEGSNKKRVAIACQGGSHTAFTAGVIKEAAPRELSLLQCLLSRKPGRDALEDIPKRTVIG